MSTGQRLKEIKAKLGYNVASLAQILDINERTIGGYERDENPPNSKFLIALAEKLQINANWFLMGTGTMFIEHGQPDANTLVIKLKKGQSLKVEYEEG